MPGKHCHVCNVYLPSLLAQEQHEKGKKHLKMLSVRQERLNLAAKSVFLHGFAPHKLSEMEISDFLMRNYGSVSRVILGPKETFAIVEFLDPQIAAGVVAVKKLKISTEWVLVKPREVNFESVPGQTTPEPDESALADLGPLLETVASPDDQFRVVVDHCRLDDGEVRADLCRRLELALAPAFPGCVSVILFGSSVNGLGARGADADMTLVVDYSRVESQMLQRTKTYLLTADPAQLLEDNRITPEELADLPLADRIRFISRLLNFVRKQNKLPVSAQQPIFSSRCPLVRFVWANSLHCDLSFNNQLAINNARWLSCFAAKSPVFVQLVFALKLWAKSKDLIGSEPHKLSSYSLNLLLITFLQKKGAFPSVEGQQPKMISGWDCSFPDNWCLKEMESASKLLAEFIKFFSGFPFKKMVVCPRKGDYIPMEEFSKNSSFPKETEFKISILNIQDPFVLTHNTSAKVGTKVAQSFKEELLKAASRLNHAPTFNLPHILGWVESDSSPKKTHHRHQAPTDDSAHFIVSFSLLNKSLLEPEGFDVAVNAFRKILTDVMDFKVVSDGESNGEPPGKKPRVELMETTMTWVVGWRSWHGRRLKRRAVGRDRPALESWEAELEVTRLLAEERDAASCSAPLMSFQSRLTAATVSDLEIALATCQTNSEFVTLANFLKTFLPKLVPLI